MRPLVVPIVILILAIACAGLQAQAVLTNSQFNVNLSTSLGGIYSLKYNNDVYNTDYIWGGKIVGNVSTIYRLGTGSWLTGNTASSSDNRTVVNNAPTSVQVNYTTNSTNASGIKNFSLYETFEIQGSSLIWTIRIKNRTAQTLEIGSLGLPLFFNTNYDADQATIMTERVVRHSFISGDGSYIFCGRSNGIGPYLLMTPLPGAKFEYFTDSGNPYDYTGYIHASQKANPAGYVGGAWRQPVTSKVLAASGSPGDEVTYAFKFTWARDYAAVRQGLVRDGLIDVQCVPGMTVPQGTTAQLSLTTNQTINSITAEYPSSTTITYVGRKYGSTSLYNVQLSKIGENKLTVDYGAGRKLYLEYFCTQPVETLIKKRATFISTKQQWKDAAKWYNGLFSLWDMKNQVLQSPDNPGTGMMAYCVGGSDDPSNCKGPYLALKNLTYPVQSEIDAVEYHLKNFVWGGLQRKDTETPYPYGIYGITNWKVNRDAGNTQLGRIYDYPAMIAMYYDMYKIAKTYPTMPKYLTASGYLERAFGTAQAFFTVPIAVWGWAPYTLGLYNEQCIPDLIKALEEEGRTADAAWLRNEWEKKVKYFIYDDAWPFGSEYAFDSTAYETSQLLASYGIENPMQPDTNLWQDPGSGYWYSHPHVSKADARAFMEKQMAANIADRGWLEPCYYQLGSDYRACDSAMYIMTYMAQMGGTGVLDYALHYTDDPATYLRLGYASYMSCWALINAGDASSNYGYWYPGSGNDGAAAWAYEPQQTGKMWSNSQICGRWAWTHDGEIDHGFMGGLRSAATIVSSDPIFGLMAYGGTMTQSGRTTTVVPNDGLRQRFHMMNVNPGLHLELSRDRFTSVAATTAPDDSVVALNLSLEKQTTDAHVTDITVSGLPVGNYSLVIDSAPQTVTVTGAEQVIHLSLPAGSSDTVSLTLLGFVHGTVRSTGGDPIPNAAVQLGGFGGPSAITGSDGTYSVRIPGTGRQTLYADALGYAGSYSGIDITSYGDLALPDIVLSPAAETGVIVNGDFETAGTEGSGSAAGWQWVHANDPIGVDFLGNAWPAINSDMYVGTRTTSDNQTPGGAVCGTFGIGSPLPSAGAISESAAGPWGTVTSVTATTITVPGVSWTTNQWSGYDLVLSSGSVKKRYLIAGNTTNVITIAAGSITGDGFAAGCSYEVCKLNRLQWYTGWLSQVIPVAPYSLYNFYFKGNLTTNTGAFWVFRWLDANHQEISSWTDSRADGAWPSSPGWNQYFTGKYWSDGWHRNVPMLQLAPPSGAKYIELCFGYTDETVQSRAATMLLDDVVVDRVPVSSIASVKSANVGDPVTLPAKMVSLAPRNSNEARTTGYFYIEEADRSCGMRVEDGSTGQDNVTDAQAVTVSGTVRLASSGERYIELTAAPLGAAGPEVRPVATNSGSVLRDQLLLGELVSLPAKVKQVAADGLSVILSDGYSESGADVLVKAVVQTGEAIDSVQADDYVVVTGVVSKEDSSTRVILIKSLTKIILPPPPPPPPVIFAMYKFDETSGTVASDFTGGGRNGTLVNGPTWVAGNYSNAVNLDGSNDYVSLPAGMVSTLTRCTVAAWVKLDANNAWNRIFDFGSGTGVNMFLTPNCSSGTIRFAIKNGGGEQQINTSSVMPTGRWQHIAVTLGDGVGVLYLNGVQIGSSGNISLKPSDLGSTTQNWIGRSQYADPYFDGMIDDLRIYDGALPASDILLLYNGQLN